MSHRASRHEAHVHCDATLRLKTTGTLAELLLCDSSCCYDFGCWQLLRSISQ